MDVENSRCLSEGEDVWKLRSLFDQIVGILNKDLVVDDKVDPFPVLWSDGRGVKLLVDLFTLYEAVWIRGGCVRVCKKGMWDSVAAELGYHGMENALRSIYMKYLNELDRRVSEVSKVKRSRVGMGSTEKNLDLLNPKLIEGKSNVNGFDDERRGKEVSVSVVDSEIIFCIEHEKSNLDLTIREFARKLSHYWKRTHGGGEKNRYLDKNEKSASLKTGASNIGTASRKRKREPIHSMLKWVTRIAKHPMISAPDINHKRKEYYAQSLLARRVLFVKGPDGGNEASLEQNKMTVQASYYDDHTGFDNQSTGTLRCSKQVSSLEEMEACEKPTIELVGRKVNESEVVEMDVENLRCLSEGEEGVWKLRSLFGQIVGILNKDLVVDDKVDPFPVLCSDGRGVELLVDLFKLYKAVWMRGGCVRVCKKGMWDSVAEELRYHGMKKALKSIYMKYLNELDRRVSEVLKVKGSRVGKGSTEKKLDLLSPKLIEGKSKVSGFDDERRGKEVSVSLVHSEMIVCVEPEKSNLDLPIREFARKLSRYWKRTQSGGEKNRSHDKDEKSVSLKTGAFNIGTASRKRKREPIHCMLKWVTRIAKHPMISAPDINHKSKDYYAQSLMARRVLFVRGPDGGNEASLEQNKMAIQASYYDDHPGFNNQSTGILRCSKRVSSLEEMEACEKPSVEMVEQKVNEGEVVGMDVEKWICLSDGEDEEKLEEMEACEKPSVEMVERKVNEGEVVEMDVQKWICLSDGEDEEKSEEMEACEKPSLEMVERKVNEGEVVGMDVEKWICLSDGEDEEKLEEMEACEKPSVEMVEPKVNESEVVEMDVENLRCLSEGEEDVWKLRNLFDQIVGILNEDLVVNDKVNPFPVLCSDGRGVELLVDLFKLYKAVWMRGGCVRVCKKGMWDSVAAELRYHGMKKALKSIYMKYLSELDHKVSAVLKVKRSRVGKGSTEKKLDLLSPKLIEGKSKVNGFDDERRGKEVGASQVDFESSAISVRLEYEKSNLDLLNPKLIKGKSNVKGFDDERRGKEVSVSLVDSEIIYCIELEKSNLDLTIREFARELTRCWKKTQGGGEKNRSHDKDEKSVRINTGASNIGTASRKRKREPIHSMLKWVTRIAKHPMISAPDINHKSKDYYAQSLLARRVLFVKGPDGGKDVSLDQNKTTILASFYDDHPGFKNQSTGILRCSKRISSLSNSFLEEGSAKLPDLEDLKNKSFAHSLVLDVENHEGLLKPEHSVKDSVDTNLPSTSNSSTTWIGDIPAEKVTSVGPGYQAEVPEWTSNVIESDPKWLGTKIWPSDNKQDSADAVVILTTVGRGRSDSCSCNLPGSVACTRFHIAEKKLVLKRELGSVFYLWRFDQMGEEVALRWTRKEEDRFTQMVKRNPPSEGKCFWDFGPQYLRKKTRYMLVSYYFNVFVLRRRSYQNRVTPNEIDSDDDEKEFEMLGGMLGDEVISLPDSVFVTCGDNMQCTELD